MTNPELPREVFAAAAAVKDLSRWEIVHFIAWCNDRNLRVTKVSRSLFERDYARNYERATKDGSE